MRFQELGARRLLQPIRRGLQAVFAEDGSDRASRTLLRDPVYLTEPLVKSENFVLNQRRLPEAAWLWPCEIVEEIAGRVAGAMPHDLRGRSPFVDEFATKNGIPVEPAMGGAETMYPEYMVKLQQLSSSSKTRPR